MKAESDFSRIIKAASVYTGIVLGAGFASGQEIIRFFINYGSVGYWGLISAGIIFALSGWSVMDICTRLGVKNYDGFIDVVFGKKLGIIINYASSSFICILFCAMLAGSGAMGRQAFNLPYTVGVVVIAVLCFITFLFDLRGLVRINIVLVPLLIVGGVFFGLYSMFTQYSPVFLNGSGLFSFIQSSWVFAAVTYSSYNIITAINVLSDMGGIITNRRIAKYAGILGGFCLTLLGLCFAMPLFLNQGAYENMEIPMLAIARNHGELIEMLYMFILIAAIFTTAVSNGFAAIEWLHARLKINKFIIKIAVVGIGSLCAHVGFSNIVGQIYPIFGFIGMFEVIMIITFFFMGEKGKNTERTKRSIRRYPCLENNK